MPEAKAGLGGAGCRRDRKPRVLRLKAATVEEDLDAPVGGSEEEYEDDIKATRSAHWARSGLRAYVISTKL